MPKPKAPVFAADPASATLIVVAPVANAEDSDVINVDVVFDPSSTAQMLPRVVPFARMAFESADDFDRIPFSSQRMSFESVDDFYGFAPRPSEPFLPRIVTTDELLGRRPSVPRRVARAIMSFAAVCAVLAGVVAALVLVLSFTFKVPLSTTHASYAGIIALTEVRPVERETIAVAPLEVQPHAPVIAKPAR